MLYTGLLASPRKQSKTTDSLIIDPSRSGLSSLVHFMGQVSWSIARYSVSLAATKVFLSGARMFTGTLSVLSLDRRPYGRSPSSDISAVMRSEERRGGEESRRTR